MPTYEYLCADCSRRFDVRQGFDAEPVAPCPLCQGKARRVFHPPFVVYKTSGFYTSDQRRNGPGNYYYNSDRKEEDKATKESRGDVEPPAAASEDTSKAPSEG